MNDNSIKINSYLQNEMKAAERSGFEKELAASPALLQELQIQQRITEAAFTAGLKAEFAKALRKKVGTSRVLKYGLMIAAGFAALVMFNYRDIIFSNTKMRSGVAAINETVLPFIDPPFKNIAVPFMDFSFDAEKGDTLFIPSGSVVYFPASALMDAAGNLVKGKVSIRYREFSDPLDLFVSGIPMDYDSAGVKYNFESSGMCEINAYQNNKSLFVNPHAKPEINLTSKNKSSLHNLYFLDTAAHRWNFSGKDHITPVKDLSKNTIQPMSAATGIEEPYAITKPVRPLQASNDRQSFSIEIEPGSYEELAAYNNLKFEVLDESNYHRADADEHWDNVKLDHTATAGIYTVTFSNAARSVLYKVRPVLAGADYDAALQVFNEKQKDYDRALNSRLANDKQLSDSIVLVNKKIADKMNADRKDNDRLNALIIERNIKMKALWEQRKGELEKQFAQEQKKLEEQAITQKKQLEEMQAQADEQRKQIERFREEAAKFIVNGRLSDEIIRTFSIPNFGVWNCDHPGIPATIPVFANYTDSLGHSLRLASATVIYQGYNGYIQFPAPQNIGLVPGRGNMIWGVRDSSFFYFTYGDFLAANIRSDTKIFEFKMRKAQHRVSSYEEMKKLIRDL